jgi:hypothetical protein
MRQRDDALSSMPKKLWIPWNCIPTHGADLSSLSTIGQKFPAIRIWHGLLPFDDPDHQWVG